MSPNNSEVHVYAKKGNKWEVEHVLKEVSYTQLVVVVKSATIIPPPSQSSPTFLLSVKPFMHKLCDVSILLFLCSMDRG